MTIYPADQVTILVKSNQIIFKYYDKGIIVKMISVIQLFLDLFKKDYLETQTYFRDLKGLIVV